MDEKIAVIGSNSFLGGHLIHYALSQGFNVLGLSRSVKKTIPFNPYDWKMGKAHNLSLEQLNPSDHLSNDINIINEYQPHYIVHCADDGHVEIHDQLKNQSPLKKYVYVSSLKNDLHVQSKSNSSVIVTSTAHVYGPGQQVHELIPKIILSILFEKKFSLHEGEHATHSFIHINDMIAGIFKATCEGAPGATYHFSTDRLISIRNLVALICNRMNVSFENAVTIVDDCSKQDLVTSLGDTQEHRQLDWQPSIELEQGIDSVINWIQEWLPALKNHLTDFED